MVEINLIFKIQNGEYNVCLIKENQQLSSLLCNFNSWVEIENGAHFEHFKYLEQ